MQKFVCMIKGTFEVFKKKDKHFKTHADIQLYEIIAVVTGICTHHNLVTNLNNLDRL